ncbi:MAG: Sulfatase [Parcubacteria group bacterium GW2011_GWA2_42_11]|nr:MAG: Sulfatase [Parcubacteria group bacterium GW2011_GWA2_42_11]
MHRTITNHSRFSKYNNFMKKNLLLISLDSVRADVAYSGRLATVKALRKVGVTFLNCISSSPLTPVSHATVMTGLQPFNHGIRHLFKEKIRPGIKTLARLMKENGYATGAIVSCPGMNRWYGHNRGFDYYDDEIPRLTDGSDPLLTIDVKKRGAALKRANIVAERADQWLDKNKHKSFFLFLHFFDAHWPYETPEKFGGKNAYEEEAAYASHYLGIFLDKLKKAGLWDKTTIICFSDHGEDLAGWYSNDKAGKKLGHPEEEGHGCLLYEQTQKTILIIKDKNLPKGKNISQQVRLVDIVPTILDLFGINYKINGFNGVSLVPAIKNAKNLNLIGYSETFYPEEQKAATRKFKNTCNLKAIRINNSYKLIWQQDGELVELYNLKNDPDEKTNLFK